MGAKQTAALIPLCHPLPLSSAAVDLRLDARTHAVDITARVRTAGPTGVEMEALTAVAAAALTVYDMCKARRASALTLPAPRLLLASAPRQHACGVRAGAAAAMLTKKAVYTRV